MNTWMIGRQPVVHFTRPATPTEKEPVTSEKTFLLKGRIMAGQANLEGNTLGVSEFKWVTKEEAAELLPKEYYASVKNAMVQL